MSGEFVKLVEKFKDVIVSKINPKRIYLFGSRAMRRARKFSDFDIAFEGLEEVSVRGIRLVREKIEELSGIYSVDLINLDEVDEKFKRFIKERGKLLYERI